MSGTGKSAAVEELTRRGFDAVDTDTDDWCEWTVAPRPGDPAGAPPQPDWVWRADRMRRLLTAPRVRALFIAGCKSNQVRFYDLLDHVILLTAPVDVLLARVATRTNNPYGTREEDREEIARYVREVEPLLRARATAVWDTSTLSVHEVADRLAGLASS
jgi:RNase adaptor protein for sRNA GlmZ degradation